MVRGFSRLEVALIALFVGVAGVQVGQRSNLPIDVAELGGDVVAELRTKYGDERFSQGPVEWILRELLADRRNGTFVDVGAYDARKWSNTFRLERDLGWSGIALDAIEEFGAGYRQYRPRTRFATAFVTSSDAGTTTLHVNPDEPAVSSSTLAFVRRFTARTEARQIRNRTLKSLLDEHAMNRFDLLSMDIELGEPDALRDFPIAEYRPAVIVVEAHAPTRQWLIDYFARAGYVVRGRYLYVDTVNLYFTPAVPPEASSRASTRSDIAPPLEAGTRPRPRP